MKNVINKLSILLFAIILAACSSEDELVQDWIEVNTPEAPTTGTLDLSTYVAVGNSLTAGFADAALYPEGQENSYPNILAGQFALAGGGAFVQPDISSGNGFGGVDTITGNPIGKSFIDLEVAVAALSDPSLFSEVIKFTSGSFLTESSNKGANLNNFGVPGAKVTDLTLNGYGNLSSEAAKVFYAAFASSATASILEDAVSANPTFFTLWIGSNDVLGYALAGGDENEATITATADFQTAYGTVLASLTANGAKGIVLNVPPVTIIPNLQTVTTLSGGVNLIPLTDVNLVATLNGVFNFPISTALTDGDDATNPGYNQLLAEAVAEGSLTQAEADMRTISWEVGANPPMITDESLTAVTVDLSEYVGAPAGSVLVPVPQYRQAKVDATTGSSDLFPLAALSVVGTLADPNNPNSVYGVGVAVPDKYTLTMSEQVEVITAYATFNAIIDGIVAANPNVTLVDVRPLFADMYGLTAAQAAGLQLGDDAVAAADGEIGIEVGGINLVPLSLSQDELYNSVWSTDGVHPNPRGAALIANEIIRAINNTYGASLPEVNPLDYAPINAPF